MFVFTLLLMIVVMMVVVVIVMLVKLMTVAFDLRVVLTDAVLLHVPVDVGFLELDALLEVVGELRLLHRMPCVEHLNTSL